jgi:hypothetical protein
LLQANRKTEKVINLMAYSSESSAQEYATTISQLIIGVNQTHSRRHQLLAVVERISYKLEITKV